MNVVFDFGKVLFDWDPQALVARLLPARAGDAAAAQALVLDFFQGFQGDWGDFDRGRLDAGTLADRIARRTGLAAAEARAVIDAVAPELAPMAGMQALLARLRGAGHSLYFLSNMPPPYAAYLDATHRFLKEHFRDGIYSGRVDLIKPEPGIFAHAVERFGIDPAETLFVDDVPANVEAARAAGWQGIGFENPAQCEAEMRRRGLL